MSIHANDYDNMRHAFDGAKRSAKEDKLPAGAAIVFDVHNHLQAIAMGQEGAYCDGNRLLVVGRVYESRADTDPTCHAEWSAFDLYDQALADPAGFSLGETGENLTYVVTDQGFNAETLPEHLTLYLTMSPCETCVRMIVERRIPRIVIGENKTFQGNEQILTDAGIEVAVLQSDDCTQLVNRFIDSQPDVAEKLGLQRVDSVEP